MAKIRDMVGKWIPFAFWIFMTILMIFGIISGAMQGGFFGICGIVGCFISAVIFGWQAYGEWLEQNNY